MLIDTRTDESMISSLATYLNITEDELFHHIDSAANKARIDNLFIDHEIFDDEVISLISDLQPKEQIDEIYVYHLTRRLNDSIVDKSSDNLKSLLLKESPLSKFLGQYNIFFVEKDGHPVIVFNNNEISLEDESEPLSSELLFDSLFNNNEIILEDKSVEEVCNLRCYLRYRLGYDIGDVDYCFNGFAFRNTLMKNYYAKKLEKGPEFLLDLSSYLSIDDLIENYYENSKYYCFTYKMTIDEIIFDEGADLENQDKINYFLVQIIKRIMSYMKDGKYISDDDNNPIIRIADDANVPESKLVNVEEITPGDD